VKAAELDAVPSLRAAASAGGTAGLLLGAVAVEFELLLAGFGWE
jgi:hypothetical protein